MEIVLTVLGAVGASSVISAFITRRLVALENKQQKQEEENLALKNGVQALLRANIIQCYNKYIEKGEIPIYERENIDHLYNEYKTLGGNGVVESLIEKLEDLPTPRNH